jgi:hypothetical protein
MKLYFRSLAWLLLLWISPSCVGQVVRVRVVNGKNGQPLVKQPIAISLQYRPDEPKPTKYDARLSLETDANGVVRISLPEPAPAHLSVSVDLTVGILALRMYHSAVRGLERTTAGRNRSRRQTGIARELGESGARRTPVCCASFPLFRADFLSAV